MILSKRNSLEQFIREQIVGPGISGHRFLAINDDELLANNIRELQPIHYTSELINILPAAVYSSGILFPVDKSKESSEVNLQDPFEKEGTGGDEEEYKGGPENESEPVEEEDSFQIDQLYPNVIGLTCCLNTHMDSKGMSIVVKARYYSEIDIKQDGFNEDFGILYEGDPGALTSFIAGSLFTTKVRLENRGHNWILLMSACNSTELTELRQLMRSLSDTRLSALKDALKEFEFVYRSRSMSSFIQGCYYELKNGSVDPIQRTLIYETSQQAECIENIIGHLTDLIDIKDSRNYGLWQSNPLVKEINLPEGIILDQVKGKQTYTYKDHPDLRDIFIHDIGHGNHASLSVNIQVSKDTRKNDNKVFVKIQLVNTSTHFRKTLGDSRYYSLFNKEINLRCFFGVGITVRGNNLIPYNDNEPAASKDRYNEDDVTKYIYRRYKDYGIGHGCSVRWDRSEEGTVTVSSDYLPVCNTPDVDPSPKDKGNIIFDNGSFVPGHYLRDTRVLEFKWLSTLSPANGDEIIQSLHQFIDTYGNWINNKRRSYEKESEGSRKLAMIELGKCETDKERMLANVENLLNGDNNTGNLSSFRMMNTAMFIQLWHSLNVRQNAVKQVLDSEGFAGFDIEFYKEIEKASTEIPVPMWRPFQLAFILLNLDGILKMNNDTQWKMRNEFVDLVWFPTGGGKTEAYLGIIALTIVNRRRLHGERGGGTAALMRYTLRLLTLQQFQRATLMIMALELMRRWGTYPMGEEPIYIGLWVGDDSLPNRLDDLVKEFQKLSEHRRSKVPFDHCPWCGSELSPSQQTVARQEDHYNFNRLHLRCSHVKCSFSYIRPARARSDQGPIPVSLCDEEIYQHPPSLLFGTVDKFAQLAHKVSNDRSKRNADSRRIFGKGNWEDGKPGNGYLTPDLIIQDELHLLLGPLGSSVALFECAIDQLCTREDGTRPKIISSTATTRNTDHQIMALFDRRVNLFPKQGVECDDSFFAFYKRKFTDGSGNGEQFISKRRYIGILPTGRTQIWMQMRLAAILMTHRAIFELKELEANQPIQYDKYVHFEKAIDYYHTIISYFNSLKEVGKTESQIHSYILKEIRRVFNRVLRPGKLMHGFYTYTIKKAELTGRLSGEEVKNELERVQMKWDPQSRFANVKDNKVSTGQSPPDFVVATNMISVGIDVSRFNSMLVNSMPRNIAEYIQASSRVARDSFGLVLTIHHPFRARDISHYEKFIEFHEKMYSYVEPISITPFTKNAVDRYLGLYLATMIRHVIPRFSDRLSAAAISQLNDIDLSQLIERMVSYFDKRQRTLHNGQFDFQIKNLIKTENVQGIREWITGAITEWKAYHVKLASEGKTLVFNHKKKVQPPNLPQEQLYVDLEEYEGNIHSDKWQVPSSLRVIEAEAILKIKLK